MDPIENTPVVEPTTPVEPEAVATPVETPEVVETPVVEETEEEVKQKSGFQKRLERAKQSARQEAQQEVEFWKAKAMEGQPQAQAQAAPTDKPKLAQFPDIESYTEAVTDWKLAQLQNHTAAQKQQETYATRVKDFEKEKPDFQQVVAEFINDYRGVNIPELMAVAADSDKGPQLAYHMATHPDDMERILQLPSHRRLVEFGKIEARLEGITAAARPRITSAPTPVKPVTGATPATTKDPKDMAPDEWIRWRNKQTNHR